MLQNELIYNYFIQRYNTSRSKLYITIRDNLKLNMDLSDRIYDKDGFDHQHDTSTAKCIMIINYYKFHLKFYNDNTILLTHDYYGIKFEYHIYSIDDHRLKMINPTDDDIQRAAKDLSETLKYIDAYKDIIYIYSTLTDYIYGVIV